MQLLAVVFIIHCVITLHVSGTLCTYHQEYIKTVDAVTGTNHASMWCKFRSVKYVQGRESTTLSHGQIMTLLLGFITMVI